MLGLDLAPVARRVVTDLAGVEAGEEVLVTVDDDRLDVGRALATAARGAGADASLVVAPRLPHHNAEPPAHVAAAMRAADVLLAANTHSVTHTDARREAAAAGTRCAILRGVTAEMMTAGAMTADFDAVARDTALVRDALAAADRAHVATAAGTDVQMSLAGRDAIALDGRFHDYGFSNLPPGLAVTAPVEGTAEGDVVLDGSMDGVGRLDDPVTWTIRGGRVVDVTGGRATREVRAAIETDENADVLCELAVGTNPAARLTGNLAEDKKRVGTVDFAVGDNTSIGGETESETHLDAVALEATVTLDGETVVAGGDVDRDACRAVANDSV